MFQRTQHIIEHTDKHTQFNKQTKIVDMMNRQTDMVEHTNKQI